MVAKTSLVLPEISAMVNRTSKLGAYKCRLHSNSVCASVRPDKSIMKTQKESGCGSKICQVRVWEAKVGDGEFEASRLHNRMQNRKREKKVIKALPSLSWKSRQRGPSLPVLFPDPSQASSKCSRLHKALFPL